MYMIWSDLYPKINVLSMDVYIFQLPCHIIIYYRIKLIPLKYERTSVFSTPYMPYGQLIVLV